MNVAATIGHYQYSLDRQDVDIRCKRNNANVASMVYEKDTNNTLKSKYNHQRATPFINVHKLTNTPPPQPSTRHHQKRIKQGMAKEAMASRTNKAKQS